MADIAYHALVSSATVTPTFNVDEEVDVIRNGWTPKEEEEEKKTLLKNSVHWRTGRHNQFSNCRLCCCLDLPCTVFQILVMNETCTIFYQNNIFPSELMDNTFFMKRELLIIASTYLIWRWFGLNFINYLYFLKWLSNKFRKIRPIFVDTRWLNGGVCQVIMRLWFPNDFYPLMLL